MVPLNYFILYNQALKFSLSNWALLVKLSPKLFALMGKLGGSKANEQKNIIREMEQSSAWERDQLFAGLSQDNSAWMHDWDRLCHCESCLSCLSIRFRTSLLILIPRTILRPSSPILHVHSTLPWKESERRWPQSFPYTSTSQSISITWYELLVHNMASSNKCSVGSS